MQDLMLWLMVASAAFIGAFMAAIIVNHMGPMPSDDRGE